MTDAKLATVFTIPDSVVFRELEGEAVLLNLDSGQYFGLNAVGTRMWQLLGESGRPQAVIDAMIREFDVDRSDLERDLLALLDRLADHGLVAAEP